MGTWNDPTRNLIANPQLRNRTGDIPDGWVDNGFTGNVNWDDQGEYDAAVVTAVNERPRLRQNPVAGDVVEGAEYTLYAYLENFSLSGPVGGSLRTLFENQRLVTSSGFAGEGWYAIGMVADSATPVLELGIGFDNSVSGLLKISRPALVAGFTGVIEAEGDRVGPLVQEPVLAAPGAGGVLIEDALRMVLLSTSEATALIGARVYPAEPPQAPVYPYVTYEVITGEDAYHMEGPAGLAQKRVQFNCDAAGAGTVKAVARAVTAALGGFRGPVTIPFGSPPAQVRIQGVFKVMERDEPAGEVQAAGLRVWRRILDFNVWFEE